MVGAGVASTSKSSSVEDEAELIMSDEEEERLEPNILRELDSNNRILSSRAIFKVSFNISQLYLYLNISKSSHCVRSHLI